MLEKSFLPAPLGSKRVSGDLKAKHRVDGDGSTQKAARTSSSPSGHPEAKLFRYARRPRAFLHAIVQPRRKCSSIYCLLAFPSFHGSPLRCLCGEEAKMPPKPPEKMFNISIQLPISDCVIV
jgi:hypothetical protein